MSDMKLSEALNIAGQMKGVFRAFEKIEDVLEATRKAEHKLTKLRLEGEQIAADTKREVDKIEDQKRKAEDKMAEMAKNLESAEAQYDKKRVALKAEFTEWVNDITKQKDGLQARYDEKNREFSQKLEKKKAESTIKVEAMKRELNELRQSIDALKSDKSKLEKEMGI